MGEFLEAITRKKKSPAAIYHKFRTGTLSKEYYYAFVEGYEDKEFFSGAFRKEGMELKCTICYGKKNLDDILNRYKDSPVNRVRVLFIRDRDFDAHLGQAPEGQNLFLTCGYSVENYISTPATIFRYASEKMGVDDDEVDIEEISKRFQDLALKLNDWLTPVYARNFEALRRGVSTELDALKFETYCKKALKDEALPDADTLKELEKMNLADINASEESKSSAEDYVATGSSGLRGKYILKALVEFLKKEADVLLTMHKNEEIVAFNRAVVAQISSERVFSDMAVRTEPTDRLRRWLKSVK
jgi:hypothetical protein